MAMARAQPWSQKAMVCHGEEVSADLREEAEQGQPGMFLPDQDPGTHAEWPGTPASSCGPEMKTPN